MVFETNDYTEWGGLSGYQAWIGGPPTPSWSQPALAYFVRGRQVWYPYYPADTLPTAYAYYGGSWANNVIFSVGLDPPLTEWGEMGHDYWIGFQPERERLYWGWLLPQPPEGTMMWHNG